MKREAAAVLRFQMLVPLDVAAASHVEGAGCVRTCLESKRREVVRRWRALTRFRLGFVYASAAGEPEVGALTPSLVVPGQDARGDGVLRTRGIMARRGNQHSRDCTQCQREMSRRVHENVPFLSLCMWRTRYMKPNGRKGKAGASTRVLGHRPRVVTTRQATRDIL